MSRSLVNVRITNVAFARKCYDIVAGNSHEKNTHKTTSSVEILAIAIRNIDVLCFNFIFRNIVRNIR